MAKLNPPPMLQFSDFKLHRLYEWLSKLHDYLRDNVGSSSGSFSGASTKLTSNETISNSTDTAINWDGTNYDTDSIWNAGNAARLTVPANVSKVRLYGYVEWTGNTSGHRLLSIKKNNTADLIFRDNREAVSTAGQITTNVVGPVVLDVEGGDYFRLFAFQNTGSNLDILLNRAFFAMDIVE